MATIFTKIINGEIPCYKIAEDENNFAFLDINPLTEGHTLVVPKLQEPESDYLFNLDDATYLSLMSFAKKVAKAIAETIDCKRVGVAVMGMEVPHVHVHLIPINKESDMVISNPKKNIPAEDMSAIAAKIASNYKKFF